LLLASRVSAIEFVRVGKVWNVLLTHGLGVLLEIRMVYSIDGVDPLAPVESHQIAD
jgi:hypothetical protein